MKKIVEQKGVISLEILFSIIVIVGIIFLGIIVSAKINLESKIINKNAEASVIATNILESMNSKNYNEFEEYINEISIVGMTKQIIGDTQNIVVNGNEIEEKFFETEIPKGYIVDIQINKLRESFNLSKQINIKIKYDVAGKEEIFEIETTIEYDKIVECNEPIINDEYFSKLGLTTEYYNIIPIKYSHDKKSYVKTTKNDVDWYNYSAKEWAKVLVFLKDGDDLESQFIDEYGVVKNNINYNNSNVNINNYIYVWIPNFSIRDGISYFRYKTSKNSIKRDFSYVDSKYLHLNIVGEEVPDISEECSFDGIYGVWRKLDNQDDIYYKNFNLTKYAPIKLY